MSKQTDVNEQLRRSYGDGKGVLSQMGSEAQAERLAAAGVVPLTSHWHASLAATLKHDASEAAND